MKNIPEIRFKGFEEEYEQCKIGDICTIGTGKSNTQDQVDGGKYPFFIRSDTPVKSDKYLYDCEAVITIGDGEIGKVFHYIDGKFDLHQRCYKMTDFKDILGKYFFHIFFAKFHEQTERMSAKMTVDSVRLDMISEMNIQRPKTMAEQKQISNMLTDVDFLIASYRTKYEMLQTIRKVLLDNVFSKDSEHVPKIRFNGFTDNWKQYKLSDIATKVTEKNIELQFIEALTNSAEFGIISQRDFFDHDVAKLKNLDRYYIVQNDDFVYNPRISTSAPVGPINRNKLGRTGVISPLYTVFRSHDIDTTYLEHFFKSSHWHSFMNLNGDTGARSDRFSIKDNIFFQMPIQIPQLEEQRKIGEYLTNLEHIVILYQQKLNNLQSIKNALSQKMFV